jgi:hypothetical protein
MITLWRLSLVLALLGMGCGWDGLFFTPRGFDATEAPRVVLVGNAKPGAALTVISAEDEILAQGQAPSQGEFRLSLAPEAVGQKLQILAQQKGATYKTLVPFAAHGVVTGVGELNAFSTAITQLVLYKVQADAGSTLAATPAAAITGLVAEIQKAPASDFLELQARIEMILALGKTVPVPCFLTESYLLSESFVAAAAQDLAFVQAYDAALAAAAASYELVIRCDPSRLNVLFAVDASGRGRDGIGNPQLIRQATKESKIYLGLTSDESSPVLSDLVPRQLNPNDPEWAMSDDGKKGDERAGDGVFSVVVPLPRGARIKYKYTNGVAGEGFTGTEEWPGNARILEIEDVLTSRPDGKPDCLLVRRDAFGDEATNKNFVNLNPIAKKQGGVVRFQTDLGGIDVAVSGAGLYIGGLDLESARQQPLLTPQGVPEARENGTCQRCPAPLILDPNDQTPPELLFAERVSTTVTVLRFSEPILADDAQDTSRYLLLNDAGQSVPVLTAQLSGTDVRLGTEPMNPVSPARVKVRALRDVSAAQNELLAAETEVLADVTAPKILSVQALGLLDHDPTVTVLDPTVGELIRVQFDEAPERSAAEDPARYVISGLKVLFAVWQEDSTIPTVLLRTEAQQKGAQYVLTGMGLRDWAGNALKQSMSFDAFALYRTTFSVVPGFAYADSDGQSKGLPRQEQLYLTGTPLGVARDLFGRRLSIFDRGGRRTDVTGWPQFEMKPGRNTYEGQAVYEIDLLLPPGRWAWKAAHGVAGEYMDPPTTLEKVYKTLSTANDGTGVRIDPASMLAANAESYIGARLSETGDDPPRRTTVFKREAPDEVCDVVNRDLSCPMIVVGAWRDWILDPGGRTRDYDDGLITLAPHRPSLPDLGPPILQDVRARDSFSVLLSFSEGLAMNTPLEAELRHADTGAQSRVVVVQSPDLPSHQIVLTAETPFERAQAYTVRYRGARDQNEPPRTDRSWRTLTFLAPTTLTPLRPLIDTVPPKIIEVIASDITKLEVRFDEVIDPETLQANNFVITPTGMGNPLDVLAVTRSFDGKGARLVTPTQPIRGSYELRVQGIGDIADPANVITSTRALFTSFGELIPPSVLAVQAVDAHHVLIRFDERIQAARAMDISSYRIDGLQMRGVMFSGDPLRRSLAFNSDLAPLNRSLIVLETSTMNSGQNYALLIDGIQDLSGNVLTSTLSFSGVDSAPLINIVLEYEISDTKMVAGRRPARAIGLADFSDSREGLYIVGARLDELNQVIQGDDGPVNRNLGGFPVEGQPLEGIETRLKDDGLGPDKVADDGIFSVLIEEVPLGTKMVWKAFAPYTTQYRDENPTRLEAAFADALPGPSVYADGQEYPGNENGALILNAGGVPGVLRIRCLFGDEITYKKNTGSAVYHWAAHDDALVAP